MEDKNWLNYFRTLKDLGFIQLNFQSAVQGLSCPIQSCSPASTVYRAVGVREILISRELSSASLYSNALNNNNKVCVKR